MSDVWKFDEDADLPGDLPSAWDEIIHLRLAYASLIYEMAELRACKCYTIDGPGSVGLLMSYLCSIHGEAEDE